MPTKIKSIRLLFIPTQIALLGLVGFVLFRFVPTAHAATTITVTTNSDVTANDGECTLREAIIAANDDAASGAAAGECAAGSGADTINFAITGTADFTNSGQNGYTIHTLASYPNITSQVTINGYSQTGSAANTATAPNPMNGRLLIELDGSLGGGIGALSLRTGSDNSVIKGLVINSFAGGVSFVGSNDSKLQGCYIGTSPTGQIAKSNGTDASSSSVAVQIGDTVTATDTGTSGNLVGGTNPADRNVVSGNYGGAFGVSGVDSIIQGNYIGLAADGVTALGNSFGTDVTTGNLTIDYADGLLLGGDAAGATNVISAGSTGGVQPDYSNNIQVIKNLIGTDYTGTLDRGNGLAGVSFAFSTTDSEVRGNTIAFNHVNGVSLTESQDISIISNNIHDNGGVGINIDQLGVIANDPLDPDAGTNDYLNFPEYTNVQELSGSTNVDYTLDVPAGDYRIEFFSNTTADPSGYGEGQEYLGFQNVTSAGTGVQSFSHTLTGVTGVTHLAMTTTEIDNSDNGFGATSEFGSRLGGVDFSLAKQLLDPQNVAPGATIHYNLTLTQNGAGTVDLSQFDGGGASPLFSSMFIDFLPPELTYAGSSNPDITCMDTGTDLTAFLAGNHADWHAIMCVYTGSGQILEQGESASTNLEVTVANDSDLVFTNYAITSLTLADPESMPVFIAAATAAGGSGSPDFIDWALDNPSDVFASAAFPVAQEPDNNGSSGNANANAGSSNGGLAGTGQSTLLVVGVASLLLLSAGTVLSRRTR